MAALPNGLDDVNQIKQSAHDGNYMGVLFGLLGVVFVGVTVYSMFISAKVNHLNIKKLNSEGFS